MTHNENAETLARIEAGLTELRTGHAEIMYELRTGHAEIMYELRTGHAEITLALRGIHEGLTSHIDFIKRLTAIIEEGNMTRNATPYIEAPDSLEPEPRPGVSEAERMAEWNRRHDARDALVLQRRYGRLQPEPSWPNRVTLDATTGMVLKRERYCPECGNSNAGLLYWPLSVLFCDKCNCCYGLGRGCCKCEGETP